MDYETIVTFISSVGFPIVAFYLMYQQNTKTLENVRKSLDKTSDAVDKLTVLVKTVHTLNANNVSTLIEREVNNGE